MRSKSVIPIGTVLIALLLLAGTALAADGELTRHVIGGGGGPAAGGACTLNGTIGQAIVGRAVNMDNALCSGFWCGVSVEYRVYLPLVVRNNG